MLDTIIRLLADERPPITGRSYALSLALSLLIVSHGCSLSMKRIVTKTCEAVKHSVPRCVSVLVEQKIRKGPK